MSLFRPDTEAGGVFPAQWIRSAITSGAISATPAVDPAYVQPNSLDLRVGDRCSRLECSFLPREVGVAQRLSGRAWPLKWYDLEVGADGLVLERDLVYLFPLCERLRLPGNVYARSNPKSTTGRLDVFTRLVTETATSFDEAPAGYAGPLYLQVVPRSFAIRVRPGDSLAQIRFQTGDPNLSPSELATLLDSDDVVLDADLRTLRSADLALERGLLLSLNLPRKGQPRVGYQARKNTPVIDFRGIGQARVRHHWDRIHADNKPIILEPDEFYIFASKELVRLPPGVCAEMVAFNPASGELRTHYAGFFDSGFGYVEGARPSETAAAVVLELRCRDVPFLVEDGQPILQLRIMRNVEPPDIVYGASLASSYQSQRLRLSKQFQQSEDEPEADDMQRPLLF